MKPNVVGHLETLYTPSLYSKTIVFLNLFVGQDFW